MGAAPARGQPATRPAARRARRAPKETEGKLTAHTESTLQFVCRPWGAARRATRVAAPGALFIVIIVLLQLARTSSRQLHAAPSRT